MTADNPPEKFHRNEKMVLFLFDLPPIVNTAASATRAITDTYRFHPSA